MNTIDGFVGRLRAGWRRGDGHAAHLVVAGAAVAGIPPMAVGFGHEFEIASALLVAVVGAAALGLVIGASFDDRVDDGAEPARGRDPGAPCRADGAPTALEPELAVETRLLASGDD